MCALRGLRTLQGEGGRPSHSAFRLRSVTRGRGLLRGRVQEIASGAMQGESREAAHRL